MYKGVSVLRLVPDRQGVGGAKFGYHSFQQQPINDTRDIKNVFVWQDSWRSDQLPQYEGLYNDTYAITPDFGECLALHGYVRFSKTDPSVGPSTEIIGHNAQISYGAHIWNFSSFVDYTFTPPTFTWDSHIISTADPLYPAIFVNIGDRCFFATGIHEAQIYESVYGDDRFSNGFGAPKVYSLGVGAPTAAPGVSAVSEVASAECYVRDTSVYMSHPDPDSALFNATSPGSDTLRLVADGITWDAANQIDIVSKQVNTDFAVVASTLTVSIANGSDIAYFDPVLLIPTNNEWVGLTLTVNGFSAVMMAFGNATPAESPAVPATACKLSKRYVGTRLPFTPGGSGGFDPRDDIVSQPFTVTGVRWTMQRGGVDVAWAGGTSGVNTVIGQMLDSGGMIAWDTAPPSYAYAWYDPLSGHISNISPVWSPASTSSTATGIQVNVDQGSISYPPSTSSIPALATDQYATRWTHILFFRTLMNGGSTLYPIGSLQPTVEDPENPGTYIYNTEWKGLPNSSITSIPPTGTNNYWFDTARDSELLVSGALRAPQFTNGKPKIIQQGVETILTPTHMAYWDGRLWMSGLQDPSALHYSCDRVQCPFGIPEESFPDTNVLRIPAEDGCVRGMKLIGERLLVTTDRWAYVIAGNNESNYRLVRISTRMAGVGDYQMAEFTPDVEGETAVVVFIGTDAKVYAMPLGGQPTWISKEIQTTITGRGLDYRSIYSLCRVHCFVTEGRRLLLLHLPLSTINVGYPAVSYIYDFDTRTWAQHTFSSHSSNDLSGAGMAWASTPTYYRNSQDIYTTHEADWQAPISPNPQVSVYSWFNDSQVPVPSGYVRTFPMDFDGKKTRKRLHFVRIYVNDRSFQSVLPPNPPIPAWQLTLRVDSETTGKTAAFLSEYDTAYNKLITGGTPVDDADATELIVTDAALSPDTPIMGYTFDVTINFPGQSDRIYRLYAIEVGWSTLSEGQEDI